MEKKNSLGTICFLSAFVIILYLGAMGIIGCFLWDVIAFAQQKEWGGVALFGLFVVFAIVIISRVCYILLFTIHQSDRSE